MKGCTPRSCGLTCTWPRPCRAGVVTLSFVSYRGIYRRHRWPPGCRTEWWSWRIRYRETKPRRLSNSWRQQRSCLGWRWAQRDTLKKHVGFKEVCAVTASTSDEQYEDIKSYQYLCFPNIHIWCMNTHISWRRHDTDFRITGPFGGIHHSSVESPHQSVKKLFSASLLFSKQNRPPFHSWHNHDFHINHFIHFIYVVKQMHIKSGKYLKKYKISLKSIFLIPCIICKVKFQLWVGLINAILQYNTLSMMCILVTGLKAGLKINKGPLLGYIDSLHLWLPVGLQSIQFGLRTKYE